MAPSSLGEESGLWGTWMVLFGMRDETHVMMIVATLKIRNYTISSKLSPHSKHHHACSTPILLCMLFGESLCITVVGVLQCIPGLGI